MGAYTKISQGFFGKPPAAHALYNTPLNGTLPDGICRLSSKLTVNASIAHSLKIYGTVWCCCNMCLCLQYSLICNTRYIGCQLPLTRITYLGVTATAWEMNISFQISRYRWPHLMMRLLGVMSWYAQNQRPNPESNLLESSIVVCFLTQFLWQIFRDAEDLYHAVTLTVDRDDGGRGVLELKHESARGTTASSQTILSGTWELIPTAASALPCVF